MTLIFASMLLLLLKLAMGLVQVRNTATIGGNIVNASPISDINAIMMASGAVYELASAEGGISRIRPEHFLTGYRHAFLCPVLSVHDCRAF